MGIDFFTSNKVMRFGEAIKWWRDETGFTQKAFAKKLGVHWTTLQQWEYRHVPPNSPAWLSVRSVVNDRGWFKKNPEILNALNAHVSIW